MERWEKGGHIKLIRIQGSSKGQYRVKPAILLKLRRQSIGRKDTDLTDLFEIQLFHSKTCSEGIV